MHEAYWQKEARVSERKRSSALLFTAEKSAPMRENEWEALAEIAIGCTFADCWAGTRKGSKGHWLTRKDSGLRPPSHGVRLDQSLYHMVKTIVRKYCLGTFQSIV